jgi:hypothetical protein
VKLDHVLDARTIAPTLAEQAATSLSAAQDILKKSVLSDAENQKISSQLGAAINLINAAGTPDDDLQKAINARLALLRVKINAFTANVVSAQVRTAIEAQVPLPFRLLPDAGPQAYSQLEQDALTRKLGVIADLVQLHPIDPHLHAADREVTSCLTRQDYVSLLLAEQLVAELKEGISVGDLRAEITAIPPRIGISIDRDTVRINTPIMMKLVFNRQCYNRAAARRRIQCTWDFDHGNLTEKGWEIYHYFPFKRPYNVTVEFADDNLVPIVPGGQVAKPVDVQDTPGEGHSHFALEFQRWLAGFFVAVVGLFAGAKEKIVSLDTASAIFAIFLLGFGIDMAKNLLVANKSSSGAG